MENSLKKKIKKVQKNYLHTIWVMIKLKYKDKRKETTMKKIQVWNSNKKMVFEGTFQEYKKYIRTHYWNDNDSLKIVNY